MAEHPENGGSGRRTGQSDKSYATARAGVEDDLIRRYFNPLASEPGLAEGLQDDAAWLTTAAGTTHVLTKDVLVAGVHFFPDDDPRDIGWKALAVNLSDLAAKGAKPTGYLLGLALAGGPDETWLGGFAAGLQDMQSVGGCTLAGGDTVATPGPTTVSITAFGEAGSRRVLRSGARPGDRIMVSGTIGDSSLGLMLRRGDVAAGHWPLGGRARDALVGRYLRPQPRLALRNVVRTFANAAMDVSDGLVIDLGRMCRASQCSAQLHAAHVPLSEAGASVVAHEHLLLTAMLTGGDDYEILMAVAPDNAASAIELAQKNGLLLSDVGEFTSEHEAFEVTDAAGRAIDLQSMGYQHF